MPIRFLNSNQWILHVFQAIKVKHRDLTKNNMVVLHSTTVKCFAKIRNLDNVNLQTSNCKLQFTVSQVKPDAKGLYCLHCAWYSVVFWSFSFGTRRCRNTSRSICQSCYGYLTLIPLYSLGFSVKPVSNRKTVLSGQLAQRYPTKMTA